MFTISFYIPANGYRYIQFHIEGKDFTKVKRSSLEAMRMTAARLMIVPPEFVVIAGIEPSSSLLITFMIPERFIKYLEAALNKKPVVKELTHMGIDIVRIGDKAVNIYGRYCFIGVVLYSISAETAFLEGYIVVMGGNVKFIVSVFGHCLFNFTSYANFLK